jgi:hypothetical protein
MCVFKATGLLQEWATFPLRLLVGFGFMAHGYASSVADRNISRPFSRRLECHSLTSWHGRLPFWNSAEALV